MTYWAFHLIFILPVIGVLLYLNHRKGACEMPRARLGVGLIAVTALVYTTPWDNYLVYRGIWSYGPDRISEGLRLGYVPLEEYCFFLLQATLTGLYLLYFCHQFSTAAQEWLQPATRSWPLRVTGGLIASAGGCLGVVALFAGGHWLYFGLILSWACPVLALHWFYGGDHLWRSRRLFGAGLVIATFYLWVVDRVAIEWKIWSISPVYATGWKLAGLPLEEAVFFVVTNLLVIQGLLLFFNFMAQRRGDVSRK